MRTATVLPLQWKWISFFSAGLLLFTGFTQLTSRNSIARLQSEPVFLDVPVVKQSSGTSCGEAVIAMLYNFAFPLNSISEGEVIEYATSNGYYTPDRFPYTSPANMVKIAEHYAQHVTFGNVRTQDEGLTLLSRNLRSGDPVTIDVLSNFSDPDSEAHFIVVTGLSVDPNRNNAIVVHYNEPLTGTRQSSDWDGDTGLWNAWQTNGDPGGAGWWMVISPD